MKNKIKNFIYWLPLNILLIATSCYFAVRMAEHDKYCIEMPRQDLDIARDGMKQIGDLNSDR